MGTKFIVTEEEKKQIRLLYEQNLLNKTVNLFKDESEKSISKTVRVKSIEKVGDDVFFKVESPEKIKLKQDEEGSSVLQMDRRMGIPIKIQEKEFDIIYKIMCNYGKYDNGKISPIFTDIIAGIDFEGFQYDLRKSGYPPTFYNKRFVETVYSQYCKTGSKPISDFEP